MSFKDQNNRSCVRYGLSVLNDGIYTKNNMVKSMAVVFLLVKRQVHLLNKPVVALIS